MYRHLPSVQQPPHLPPSPESPPAAPAAPRKQSQPESCDSASVCLEAPCPHPLSEQASQQSPHLSGSVHAVCAPGLGLSLSPGPAQPSEAKQLSLKPAADASALFLSPPLPGLHVVPAWRPACVAIALFPRRRVLSRPAPGVGLGMQGPDGLAFWAPPQFCWPVPRCWSGRDQGRQQAEWEWRGVESWGGCRRRAECCDQEGLGPGQRCLSICPGLVLLPLPEILALLGPSQAEESLW